MFRHTRLWQRAAVGIVALTALGNATALAQTATLTLVPRSAARLTPGSSVIVDVFIDGVQSPNFVQSYQTQIEVTPTAGTTGTLSLAPISTPIVVDTARSDWVFSGLSAIASVREDLLRLGALVLSAASSPEVFSPKYCGTYQFRASNDADGEFDIDFVLSTITINPNTQEETIVPTTFLIDRSGTDVLIPYTPIGTTIRVGLQPSNDDCVDSAPIFEGSTSFNNENTTTDGPSHPGTACDQNGSSTIGSDIWYDYTATCDGDLTISTCGDADFDTRIAVYDGCSCPPTTLVDCNDDATGCSGGTSEVVISATAGTCYKIRVGGFLGASGTGNITVSCVGNDTCDAADALSVPSSTNGATVGATIDSGLIACGPVNDSPGVWYVVTGTGGAMTASLCSAASYDTRLTVFQGSCTGLTCVADASDTCGLRESVSWCSTFGTPYRILVHGEGGEDGTFTLDVSSTSCNDSNACTTDSCASGSCINADTTPQGQCCNPSTGGLTQIDDGNPCSTGSCDAQTGQVIRTPNPDGPNVACDDDRECTLDQCASGSCVNTDINTLSCVDDTDCPNETTPCNTDTGLCVCVPAPTVLLVADPGSLPVQGCYAIGEQITVRVEMGFAPTPIKGAQFFLEYDSTALELLDISPGNTVDPSSPFALEIVQAVDTNAGTIDYLVGVNFGDPGTTSPAVLAGLTFQAIDECNPFVRFRPSGPNGEPNRLVGDEAVIPDNLIDLPPVSTNGTPPVLTGCPADMALSPDPGDFAAVATWTLPSASDSCDGPVPVECLPPSGTAFPTGTTTVTCTATNSCGVDDPCMFDVSVSASTVTVDVELSANMAAGPITRCITFELSDCDAAGGPLRAVIEQDLTFTNGLAMGVVVDIPGGGWDCITASDPLHTLRSTAPDFTTTNGVDYTATFVGDRGAGGHWLVGGNLNDDAFIDIVDFGMFLSQFLSPSDPNTPCGTIGPDANINGDNVVDLIDFVFVQVNSLQASEQNCCAAGGVAAGGGPITAISVRDLRRMGLDYLRMADLNQDGFLDAKDVTAFTNGVRPTHTSLKPTRLRALRDK